MIEIKHLRKSFGDTLPIADINTVINDGDIISVIGPSGTGKSTFIRCLNLLVKPTSGDILYNGKSILDKKVDETLIRRKIGMVFQQFNLYPHLTVIENIMLPQIDILHVSKQEAYDCAIKLLNDVGLSTKAFSYPDDLSGGQKQRVAIARTLALDPEVILFDEPTSALDPTMVGEVEAVIEQLSQKGKTMIIVTHQLDFARKVSNRIFFLSNGTIYEEGTPEEIFDNPKKPLTARFVNAKDILSIQIQASNEDFFNYLTMIRKYCKDKSATRGVTYRTQLFFEEIIMNNILKDNADNKDIKIEYSLEYIEKTNKFKMEIRYEKNNYNPLKNYNISINLIKSLIPDIKYSKTKDDVLGSLVHAELENK